ncbi:restriction endonuclease subunit S [Photobacterium damselae]|uniref:restriction endonuclease subunit S n=1 Tax=Photobacterium damselae TaxID=38293 RepID=UPI004067EA11
MTEQINVPTLRFGEFDCEWQKFTLKQVSTKNISYGVVQTGDKDLTVPCVRVVDLTSGSLDRETFIKTSESISLSYKKTILERGELMVALRGVIGLTRAVPEELVGCNLTRGIARISPNQKKFSSQFVEQVLNTPKSAQRFDQLKNGSALKEISIGELNKYSVVYPTLPEQQKIASFLSKVDEKITLLTEKKAKLTEYKKGVMQQLFDGSFQEQNGLLTFTPPTLRFKADDGSEFPDWEEKKLDDICSFTSGKNIKQSEASPGFSTPCVRYGELYHMYGEVITTVVNRTNLEPSELTFSKGDEILLPSAGEDPLDIGAASALTLKDVAIGRTINVLRPKTKDSYCHIYVSYYINNKLKKKISTLARGASISNVYNSDLKGLSILLPSLEEQQVVKSFLVAIEEKIDLTNSELAKAKEWKKGLLQQMFV